MKKLLSASLLAVALFSTPTLSETLNCTVNCVNCTCGAPSNGNTTATTLTTCKDGTVVHHRHDVGANCPSCEKEKRS